MVQFRHCLNLKQCVVGIVFFYTPVVFANVDIWSSKKWKSTDHFDHSCTILIQFVFKVHVSFKKNFFSFTVPIGSHVEIALWWMLPWIFYQHKEKKNTHKKFVSNHLNHSTPAKFAFKCLIDFRGEYFPHNALCYICPAMLINLNFWSINKVTFLPNCQLGPF